MVNLCENKPVQADGSILERLEALEKKIGSGMLQAPVNTGGKAETQVKPVQVYTSEAPKPVKAAETPSPAPGQAAKADYMPEWQKVLDELKSIGRRALHSFLLDTKAVRLSDSLVGIVFNEKNKFSKTIVTKAEHMEVLEEITGSVLSLQVKIKCVDEDALGQVQKQTAGEPKDAFVEKARSIAEQAGVPLEIFEE